MTHRPFCGGRLRLLLGALVAALCLAIVAPGAASAAGFLPGQAIVRFRSATNASERSALRARAGVTFKRSLLIRGAQLVSVRGSVEAAVARLRRKRDVVYAQPNFVYHALASPPNDPLFGRLWGLDNTGQTVPRSGGGSDPGTPGIDINALGAWNFTRGAGAVIAVVDTGVDLGHPDIAANLWTNPNGPADGLHGFDFVSGDGTPNDENDQDPDGTPDPVYHGSHVAGTAAAVDNNAQGIAGVAPDARIMAVRALDRRGGGTSADIGDGITYAALRSARVVNLSVGGPGATDPAMSSAVNTADAHNVVVVAAAGNDGQDNDSDPHVPCNLPQPNLICVAAVDNNGLRPSFSDYGPTTVDVAAPGQSIWSVWGHQSPDNQYQSLDGTSMAAPHVSGVAALVARGDTAASDTQIVQAIKQSVRTLPDFQGFIVSGGIVDAAAAIQRARVLTTPPPPPPTPPAKASFRKSKKRIRVSRSGRFSVSFTAGAGLRGRITLKTVRRVSPRKHGHKRRTTFANKTFLVARSGKVKVKFKLSNRNRQILKRYKKLRIAVTVKLRNSAKLTSTAKLRITLKAPKPQHR